LKKKWMQESRGNDHERNNPKSEITEVSENGPSVQVFQDATSKANINEGSDAMDFVDNFVEDIGIKISSAENEKDCEVLNQPCNNEEDMKGITRLNYDGFLDTRF